MKGRDCVAETQGAMRWLRPPTPHTAAMHTTWSFARGRIRHISLRGGVAPRASGAHPHDLGRRCGPQVFALGRAQPAGTETGLFRLLRDPSFVMPSSVGSILTEQWLLATTTPKQTGRRPEPTGSIVSVGVRFLLLHRGRGKPLGPQKLSPQKTTFSTRSFAASASNKGSSAE